MHPASRDFLRRMVALAAMFLLALCLTQCQLVTDKLTDPSRGREASSSRCFRDCAKQYGDSLEDEQDLHEENLEKCRGRDGDRDRNISANAAEGGDRDRDREKHHERDPVCIAIEKARHEAAVQRIEDGRKQCQADCHHQGGGTGR